MIDDLYKEEIARRYDLLQSIGRDEGKIKTTMNYISQRESIIDWLVDWCWTFDPRNPSIGLPAELPMVPWLIQCQFIEWFYNQYLNQSGGLVEKSRDMGATWLFCFIFVREWRWENGFTAGIGSRKLTLVDDKENPKAIFHKIRSIINSQPPWWLPEWDGKKYDKIANITNPQIPTNNIAGEGGDDIGRGDRRSVYLVDEAAYLEHPKLAERALSQTTNSQFDLSTPNGMNEFAQKRFSGKVEVFTFDWRDDPRKDEQWHEEKVKTQDSVTVAQEIDRDYNASVENIFIPPQHVRAAVNLKLSETGICSAGLDVAAGGKNKSSLVISKGQMIKVYIKNFKNGVDLTHWAIEKCNEEGVDYLTYDPIGVGHSVHSTIERTSMPISFDYYPVGAGEATSDQFYEEFGRYAVDCFDNAKTEWWYRVSLLFKNTWEFVEHGIPHDLSEMISIPNDPELMSQLSNPLKKYKNDGKIMIETKKDMKARGIESGDAADALVMSKIPKNLGFNRVWGTYARVNYRPTNIDFKKIDPLMSQIMVVLILEKSGGIYGNIFFWGRRSKTLRVYAELEHPAPIVQILGSDIREKARVSMVSVNNMPYVNKIYCNEEMITGNRDWEFELRRKAMIRIHKPNNYDENAAILISRGMFQRREIIVDSVTCPKTNQEYKNWRIVDQKPAEGYPHCTALCIAVSQLREAGEFKQPEELKQYSQKYQEIRERLKKTTLATGAREIIKTAVIGEYTYLTK